MEFGSEFKELTGFEPMRWQIRLYDEYFAKGALPSAVSIPTGLGKTAVMAIWLIALAQQMKSGRVSLPRRLVYVVDRRAVVDQATQFAEDLRKNLAEKPEAKELRNVLGLADSSLPISTLRGQFVDNREWLEDPAKPAIVVGTVDMIGSRLLFEGYGVSRKMRPYHAGLLGADALVLLDEAHLVPPFEALLSEIAENAKRYGARDDALDALVPKFQLLPLSATGRRQTTTPFVLQESDFREGDKIVDTVAYERLHARKHLKLHDLGEEKLEDSVAKQAWALSDEGKKSVRVIVFCNKREDAEKVKARLDKNAGKENVELFVGARRVRERTTAQQHLQALGFLAGDDADRTRPSFLVATSAGEVGVDLDADHMVCDLVTWDRMVQRFGRVNRRGGEGRQAEIIAIDKEPKPKKPEQPTADEKTCIRIHQGVKQLLEKLHGDGTTEPGISVSPESLRQLNEGAAKDEALAKLITEASTPAPLRPALNRALVDAWAMTSLPEHTGRPEVAPWLRGWVTDEAQTTVAWRKYLPVRPGIRDYGKLTKREIKEIEDYFEAAPLHASEALSTESRRAFDWLKKRAAKLNKIPDADKALKTGDVAAMLLKEDGGLLRSLRLGDLLGDSKNKDVKKRLEDFEHNIKGKTLVMDARFGGLDEGLLNADANHTPPTADDGSEWLLPILISTKDKKKTISVPVIRFRVLERSDESGEGTEEMKDDDWRESLRFDLKRNDDGEATRWLAVQKWRDTSNTEDDRAEGRPQSLAEHQSWAAEKAKGIGQRLGLPDEYVHALSIAARLHDEGKKGRNWKRAFHVERYARDLGIPGEALAKTPKFNRYLLEGYRHEFGSLPHAKDDAEFQKLPPDMQDLVLHLIAAHHGFARPLISIKGGEEPPSILEERAREVALRFARLQKRWGPWGLAWWESLLRAADAQASRANDERGN